MTWGVGLAVALEGVLVLVALDQPEPPAGLDVLGDLVVDHAVLGAGRLSEVPRQVDRLVHPVRVNRDRRTHDDRRSAVATPGGAMDPGECTVASDRSNGGRQASKYS
jgi:hypothetical protein